MRALEEGKQHPQLPWCRTNEGLIAALTGIKGGGWEGWMDEGMSNSCYKNHHLSSMRGKLGVAKVDWGRRPADAVTSHLKCGGLCPPILSPGVLYLSWLLQEEDTFLI